MEAKDMPVGVTCHNQRDEKGQWWIVWGTDFVGDKPGRRLHPESVFLEEAYKTGQENEKAKHRDEVLASVDFIKKYELENARRKGMKEVVEWIPQLIGKVKDAMWQDDWGVKGVIYPEQLDGIVAESLQAFLKSKGIKE